MPPPSSGAKNEHHTSRATKLGSPSTPVVILSNPKTRLTYSPWHINNPSSHHMFAIGSPLPSCHNLNLEFVTKVRAYKGASQKWSPRVAFNAPKSIGGCEGMNPHTPKWAPTLGVRIPMDFQIFREWMKGSKLIGLKNSLYHWKVLGI
jgi:hypothetical protein